MNNYPPGAANDPNAPYNEPLKKKVKVEVSAELGTFVDVDIHFDEEYPEAEDLYQEVILAIKDKFHVDDNDTVLNAIYIWGWE